MSLNDSLTQAIPLIICFGDSLTAGYQSPTPDRPQLLETPYGEFLQERLGVCATVAVSGRCGELTGEMVARFRGDVIARKPAGVVILGGTNDLGWQAAPADILRNLLVMYDMALAEHVRPVAVTVPSIRVAGDVGEGEDRLWLEGHIQRRRELNSLIQGACLARRLPCVDLFSATQEGDSGLLARPYSNDGLHLTTAGYRRLAELLYAEVFSRTEWSQGAAT
jgi:lysophospholipase L1-like esterase